ncbi:MAG: trypsin-like peptidase domain-containing protein [Brevundimonas sp.]|uniref:trypsin-like peptidase domain-containing protein n=1 Tax=Brevundimonas sp. TaxID=1871086 RepID=UPI002727BE47|nr:trypsin-like peptidase domain-containing protein [Brevundimonas sp.]MDO9586742.1 trypsin-like peptidase domain-containing protein [Brevundimonas sp.]MDP3658194.1 trypsin-like peptidase domain-containing protein [Brevundimonas sp.]MDZ4108703.1 trypsin-like peptidase domain-containing protein [Brevundimonas sp.]
MKTRTLAIALALTLAACGQADDTRAQDGVFADNRVVPGDVLSMKSSFAPVVRTAAPAVVNISARGVQQVRDPFWGIPGQRQTGSVGSGVIVRPDGVVVTNNHVIQGMQQIRVTLNDRREFNARVVLADERSDIAVLQLEGVNERLPTLNIDDREEQQIGDLVLAIGNPFGVGQTVTNGIISALNRTETGISDSGSFIQTDAAINPGNSGGALVDMDGDLIGINTAIFSRSGSSSGVGFAVPASMVKRVVDSAVGGATAVVRPWLGVKGDGVSAEIARSLDLDRPQGLVVTQVWPNGPGARAGLREGDVITAIDGAEINDQGGLNFRVGTRAPNDTVQVAVLRDGRARTLNARVQPLPGEAGIENATVIQAGGLSGAQVLPLNPALADRLGGDPFTSGVIVGRVAGNSYASRGVGVRAGDIIISVNDRPVTSPQQLANLPRGAQLLVERRGQRGVLVVR